MSHSPNVSLIGNFYQTQHTCSAVCIDRLYNESNYFELQVTLCSSKWIMDNYASLAAECVVDL